MKDPLSRAVVLASGALVGACTALVDLPEPGSSTTDAAGGQGATGGSTVTTGMGGEAASSGGGGAGAGSGAGGSAGGPAGDCPLSGPAGIEATPMVKISDAMGDYCVDTLETTFAQYRAFLFDGGVDYVASGEYDPERCAWNDDATPPAGSGFDGWWNRLDQVDFEDDYAVRLIDWCDAKAYCTRYGKRLCGVRGGGAAQYGQTLTGGELASDTEWGFACGAGVNDYPTGSAPPDPAQSCQEVLSCPTWVDNANCGASDCGVTNVEAATMIEGSGVCLDGRNQCTKMCTENWIEMGEDVGSHVDCHGQGPGREDIYDMAGSASEWLALCETEAANPEATECYLGGGHLFFAAEFNRCNWIDTAPRGLDSQIAGIRCCADPL